MSVIIHTSGDAWPMAFFDLPLDAIGAVCYQLSSRYMYSTPFDTFCGICRDWWYHLKVLIDGIS